VDVQRQAGEAYIQSQAQEGWICLPERYDDGGYSGADMERPAIKRLMQDIEAGKVDLVLVYKVDRLSRSLVDFAQLISVFDRQGVAFVAVTQRFNTSDHRRAGLEPPAAAVATAPGSPFGRRAIRDRGLPERNASRRRC